MDKIEMKRAVDEQHQVCWRCDSFIPAGNEHVVIKTQTAEERACLPCFDKIKDATGDSAI